MAIDNFDSTADLTKNKGFPSTLTITSKDEPEKPYNPFEHRTVEHPNSTIGSTIHLLKACLGTGILAMPAAFKSSGLVAGSIGTLLAGLICQHTVQMLVKVAQHLCIEAKKPSMTFAETCGAAFTYGPKPLRNWGGFIKVMTDYTMAVTYFSVCTVYVVFIASSVKEVVDNYWPEFNITIQMYCLLTLLPLALICQIRNLKYLVPFMAVANILIVLIFIITLYYIFTDLPSISERELVVEPVHWPKFLSIVIFAMEGVGVVMPIENEMKNPERFLGCPGVWNVSMFIVVSLYTVVGFFGYIQFGEASKGSITLNLPEDEFIAQSAKLLMAVVIFFSYALQFYVPMDLITRLVNKGCCSKFENLSQICIRTFLVTFTVILAVSFPNLELVIGIAGAIFFSSLGLLFPAVVDLVYHWDRGLGKFNNVLWKDVLIIIISLIILVSGTYVSVLEMIESGTPHSDNSTNIDLS